MVVHNQLSLSVEPTFPSDKYPVMTCPSAYCATSSGIDSEICRASTQPAFLSRVRTRYQSSVGGRTAGAAAAGGSSPGNSDARGRESSTQLAGSAGGGGAGGGGAPPCLACLDEAVLAGNAALLFAFTGAAAAGITAFRSDTR